MSEATGEGAAPDAGAKVQRDMLIAALESAVEAHGATEDRAYSVAVTAIADDARYSAPEQLDDVCETLIRDGSLAEPIRYAALYVESVYLRRSSKLKQLDTVFDRYGAQFRHHPTYMLIYLTFLEASGLQGNYLTAITDARVLCEGHPEDPGMQHVYARVVLTALERYGKANIGDELIRDAVVAAQRAIDEQRTYAKFYDTKARLLVWLGRWDEALEAIDKAIDFEDQGRATYVVIVSQYQYTKTKILLAMKEQEIDERMTRTLEEGQGRMRKSLEEAEGRMDAGLERVESGTSSTMETLGFFAGIISFVLGGIDLASNYPFEEAARLIMVLMGSLLVAFAGFSYLLDRHRADRKAFAVAGLGAALIGVVLYVL